MAKFTQVMDDVEYMILTARKSTSRMRKWSDMDSTIAPSNHLLAQGGITVRDWFSEMLHIKPLRN